MSTEYAQINTLLRDLHFARGHELPPKHHTVIYGDAELVSPPPIPASTLRESSGSWLRPPRKKYQPPAASSATHASLQQPVVAAPYDSLFRKYQQQGIREWRQQYNSRVDMHNRALRMGAKPLDRVIHANAGPVTRLADETAARHLRPITEYVHGTTGLQLQGTNRADANQRIRTVSLPPAPSLPVTDRLLQLHTKWPKCCKSVKAGRHSTDVS
eukprot:7391638-Prymnesium_polylepis.6